MNQIHEFMTQAELDKAPFFVKGPAKEGAEKYARQVGASQVTLVSVSCLFTYCFTALLHALLLEKSRWCACLVECALLPPQLLRFFVRCFFYSCAAATLLRYVCVPYKQQSASNMSAMLKSNFEIYH